MYAAGDKIIYGSSGVCVVTEIFTPNFSREERGRKYYKLRPLYGTETIYAPVDTTAFMRPVISRAEADALIDQLLGLENPYACPHGRPTIIAMSKYELEKKFKRIV